MREDGDHSGEIGAVIEPPFELSQQTRRMLAARGAVGADDGALDVAEDGIDRFEFRFAGCPISLAGDAHHVRAACVDDASKTRQAIRDNGGARHNNTLGERGNPFALEPLDPLQTARSAAI